MATKNNNTLLYAGIAAAAILLLKKKDTGMAGVGAIPSSIMLDGTFQAVKQMEKYFDNTMYVNKEIDNHEKDFLSDSLHRTVIYNFPTLKAAKETIEYVMSLIPDNYNIYKYDWGNSRIHYTVKEDNTPIPKGGKYVTVSLVKGGIIKF